MKFEKENKTKREQKKKEGSVVRARKKEN